MLIAICDDENICCAQTKKAIITCFRSLGQVDPEIDVFDSGEALLESTKKYDMAFLDVEMKGISGISAGRRLYEKNHNILLFILTNYNDYIDEALKFHAFRFFQKPLNVRRLKINLRDALEIYFSINKSMLIRLKDQEIVFKQRDIAMIETNGRDTIIYTTQGIIYSVMTMTEIENSLLKNACFFRTNRGYIVNLDYVSSFGKDYVKVLNDKYISKLTKRNYSHFKKIYTSFFKIKNEI